jgi:RNA polymerase sigma factor (sigma-70 family)
MERRQASAAAAELLNQHRRLTSRLARRVGRFEAEDLASEALTRTLRRPPPDGGQQPWLERILRNLVVDRARRSRSAAVHAAELARAAAACAAPSPEEHLLAAERQRAVAAALPNMPAGLREALVGRFYEERDYDEVAAARGISPATARTRVHRALATLRVSLGRLRAVVPLPSLSITPVFSTSALLPAALGAALLVPPLALPSFSPAVRAPVVVAQASSPRRSDAPSPAPAVAHQAQVDIAPSAAPVEERRPPRGASTAATPQVVHHGPPSPATSATSPVDQAAIRRFNYEEDFVEGDIARPDDIGINGDPTSARHPSLIEIPREFVREIGKMLEDM